MIVNLFGNMTSVLVKTDTQGNGLMITEMEIGVMSQGLTDTVRS